MIPETVEISKTIQPNKTYKLDFENNRIVGTIDGLESIIQAIRCMLNTERYAHIIYSWQYGASLEKYIGKSYDYIVSDIGREIKETLMSDERILDVYDFKFEQIDIDSMKITFTVDTTEGETTQEVTI